jgi:FkbM family methyltransferase
VKGLPKRLLVRALRSRGYEIVRRQDVHSLREHLHYVLGGEGIDCVVDVGALRGDYGSFIRSAGYAGPIVSFEPVEDSYRQLVRNSADDPAWTAHRLALGSGEEVREIAVAAAPEFSSFRPRTDYGAQGFAAQTEVAHTERVEVRRLDAVAHDVLPADARRLFLKLDTQGWDLDVLEGATGVLDRIAALQVELSVLPIYKGTPTYLEALEEVTRLGFRLTDAVPIVRDRRHHVIEFDSVLVRS